MYYLRKGFVEINISLAERLHFDLYCDDENTVNNIDYKDVLTSFYKELEFSNKEFFLVSDNEDKCLCFLFVFYDNCQNKFADIDNCGYFYQFEAINDIYAVKKLFEAAFKWVKEIGGSSLIGPLAPNIKYPRGVSLSESGPPTIGMPYNKGYYNDLLLNSGINKLQDLFEFTHIIKEDYPRLRNLASKIRGRQKNLIVINFDLNDIDNECERLTELYNIAWKDNWGFHPADKNDLEEFLIGLGKYFQDDYAVLIESDKILVGFMMLMPDLNNLGKGRFRAFFMGVHPNFRRRGLESILIHEMLNNTAKKHCIKELSVCWILESNNKVINIINNLFYSLGFNKKTYRLYKM